MTISELIAKLQEMPKTAQVYINMGEEQSLLIEDAVLLLGDTDDAWALLKYEELEP